MTNGSGAPSGRDETRLGRLWRWIRELRAIEVVVAGLLWAAALMLLEGWLRWAAVAAAAVLTLLLLLLARIAFKLVAAVGVTALFATALYHDDPQWQLVLGIVGVIALMVARLFGAVVWPDVAILFLVGVALVAVDEVRKESPPPLVLPPAVAVLDLPPDRIRAPANEITAPSEVDVIALTPETGAEAGVVTHEAKRFEALVLTTVPRAGPRGPVRVLIKRGADGENARELVSATLDATELVLLPTSQCYVSASRTGLTQRRVAAILAGHGYAADSAKSYAESFTGLVDFVPLRPGAAFKRYYSGNSTVGLFLTKTAFSTSAAARDGLELPDRNQATHVQEVRVIAPVMTLSGRIKNGAAHARQYFALRPACFNYRIGTEVEPRAK